MDIDIREIKPRPVIGIRKTIANTDIGDFIKSTFESVGPFFASKGMEMTGPPVAMYFETTETTVDIAAGAPVTSVTATTEEITELELPGGRIASAIYTGSYEGIPSAWDEFMKQIAAQGESPVEPCWEEYLTDPSQEPDSSKWQTLMVQPLK